MLTAEARVATDRASWYLAKLCWHANRMGHTVPRQSPPHGGGGAPPEIRRAEWSDSHGIIDFGWGQCTLEATGGLLLLRTEAADDGSLGRLQDGIGRRLETMGRRDHLTVNWHRVEPAQGSTPCAAAYAGDASTAGGAGRRGLGWTLGLAAAVVLAVAVHLGLLGAALAASRWTKLGADAVLGLVLLVVVFGGGHRLVLGRLVPRHGLQNLGAHQSKAPEGR